MASIPNEALTISDYNLTIYRTPGEVTCGVWWNLQNYFNLKDDVLYHCPINVTRALCFPNWVLGFKKFKSVVLISLKCDYVNREVSFTLIADCWKSPFIIAAGTENSPGIYSTIVSHSDIQSFAEILKGGNFVVMYKLVLNEQDLVSPSIPNPVCSCANLAKDLVKIFISQKFSDFRFVSGENAFPAHKCFVAARSRNLAQILDMEQHANLDKIYLEAGNYISDSGVTETVRYIYTGIISSLDAELAVSVYYFAGLIELFMLQARCMDFLMCNVTVQDFMRICNFALNEKAEPLRAVVENFFVTNKREILLECFSADGKTMLRPSWIPDNEYLTLETEMKRLSEIFRAYL